MFFRYFRHPHGEANQYMNGKSHMYKRNVLSVATVNAWLSIQLLCE